MVLRVAGLLGPALVHNGPIINLSQPARAPPARVSCAACSCAVRHLLVRRAPPARAPCATCSCAACSINYRMRIWHGTDIHSSSDLHLVKARSFPKSNIPSHTSQLPANIYPHHHAKQRESQTQNQHANENLMVQAKQPAQAHATRNAPTPFKRDRRKRKK